MELTDGHLHRVVIIGSGFGGLFAARHLKKVPAQVTMISQTTHHLFQPLLYQVATGILSQGEIAPAIREVLRRQPNVECLLGDVYDIDVDNKIVKHRTGVMENETPYDTLIVAAGAGQSYFGNDHFAQFAPGMKTVDDALEVRGRIYTAFELAELHAHHEDEREAWSTFVVVGAGPTGVELAGQIAELAHRALVHDFRRFDPRTARVILVEGGDAVLSSFGPAQSARVKRQLERMGIEVQLGTTVTDIDADGVDVRDKDGTTRRISCKTKIWSAGVAASPLGKVIADQTGAKVDWHGRVHVDDHLHPNGRQDIFCIGDMAYLDHDLPGVAQVAMQGGKYAANQIRREINGDKSAGPFKYFDKGNMATISRFRAVANTFGMELHGFIAWLVWLFIHILFLVGFQQKVSTLGHWFVSFIGRGRAERTVSTYQSTGAVAMISQAQTDPVGLATFEHVPTAEVVGPDSVGSERKSA